jgi:hypothetical protein
LAVRKTPPVIMFLKIGGLFSPDRFAGRIGGSTLQNVRPRTFFRPDADIVIQYVVSMVYLDELFNGPCFVQAVASRDDIRVSFLCPTAISRL